MVEASSLDSGGDDCEAVPVEPPTAAEALGPLRRCGAATPPAVRGAGGPLSIGRCCRIGVGEAPPTPTLFVLTLMLAAALVLATDGEPLLRLVRLGLRALPMLLLLAVWLVVLGATQPRLTATTWADDWLLSKSCCCCSASGVLWGPTAAATAWRTLLHASGSGSKVAIAGRGDEALVAEGGWW